MAVFLRSSLILLAAGVLSVGCGTAPAVPTAVPAPSPAAPSVPPPATLWPTFTPVPAQVVGVGRPPGSVGPPDRSPTPVLYPPAAPDLAAPPGRRLFPPTPLPSPTALSPPAAVPSAAGGPLADGVAGATLEPPAAGSGVEAEPSPGPAAGAVPLYRGGAAFQRQTLFVMQSDQLPDYLREGDLTRLPPTKELVPRTAPYLFWFVAFDLGGAEPDFEMAVRMRWLSLGPEGLDVDPVEMESFQGVVSHREPFFYTGLRAPLGDVWPLGGYRLELVDDRGLLIGSWRFFVI